MIEHASLVAEGPTALDMIGDRETVSIVDACRLVGVSRRTIYNWMASGKIEYVRTAGGAVRILADTLWRRPEQADETRRRAPARAAEQ